jgi:hypothetical protein
LVVDRGRRHAAVVGLPVAWYYGRRSTEPEVYAPQGCNPETHGPQIVLRVYNAIPTYDLPGGGMTAGDHFVGVDVVNNGDRAVNIMGWGVKLPGNRRVVVLGPVSWSTRLPRCLEPGPRPPCSSYRRASCSS